MGFSVNCVRVGVLPLKSGKRYELKIETCLLLMLGVAVVLIIGTLLYDHRDLLKYFLPST
jgi:hypothetical protein